MSTNTEAARLLKAITPHNMKLTPAECWVVENTACRLNAKLEITQDEVDLLNSVNDRVNPVVERDFLDDDD